MPKDNKIKNQTEEQKLHKEESSERKELILHRQKMKSDIHKSRIKRDNLLSELSEKRGKAKLKESKLKAKLKEQAIKEKKAIVKDRAKDKAEIATQRKLVLEKQNEIRKNRKVFKEELALNAAEIKNRKIANRKSNIEEKTAARAVRNEQRAEYRKEQNEIKLKNDKLRTDLEEKRLIQKNKNAEIAIEARQTIFKEKARLAKEREKLRTFRNEKAAIARAKRVERLEKARTEREKIRLEREKAREVYKNEILAIKGNKIENDRKNAEILSKEKESTQEELDSINDSIETEKQEIVDTRAEMNKVNENSNTDKSPNQSNDFSDKYKSAFDDESTESNSNEKYVKDIVGSVIRSFGKKGANKFKVAQAQTIEADIAKYKKDATATEMIEKFRKLSPDAIKVKSLVGYLEILLDKKFTKEKVDQFHVHAITALLTGHSIRFANGFIMPLKNGRKLVLEFSKELDEGKTLVEFTNPEIGKELNKLINKKIKAGGNILLANGLLAIKEKKEIVLLQDTNFMKA